LLRIEDSPTGLSTGFLKVSGRLVENWVLTFEQSCMQHLNASKTLIVCIDELTFADQPGVAAVARLKALGVVFSGGTAFVRQHLHLEQT